MTDVPCRTCGKKSHYKRLALCGTHYYQEVIKPRRKADPYFDARYKAQQRAYAKKRYHTDPVYRAKALEWQRKWRQKQEARRIDRTLDDAFDELMLKYRAQWARLEK